MNNRFKGLSDGEVALLLHRQKGADIAFYLAIVFLVAAALFAAGVHAAVAGVVQWYLIWKGFNYTEAAHDKRWDEFLEWYINEQP